MTKYMQTYHNKCANEVDTVDDHIDLLKKAVDVDITTDHDFSAAVADIVLNAQDEHSPFRERCKLAILKTVCGDKYNICALCGHVQKGSLWCDYCQTDDDCFKAV